MFFTSKNATKSKNRKTTPLGVEQLETRLMNAVDGIEHNLQTLLGPQSVGTTQLVSQMRVGSTNTAPTVASASSVVGGRTVRTTRANLEVLGADDKGETKLTYQWSVVTAPQGGNVTFSINGTNKAKKTEAVFSTAGNYTLRATITDASGLTAVSNVQVSVVQTLTAIQLKTTSNLDMEMNQSITGRTLQLRVTGTDQFGNAMTTVPALTWSRTSGPSDGNVTSQVANGTTTLSFTKVGQYVVRGVGGNASSTLRVNVIQTLTSISGRDATGKVLTSGTALPYTVAKQTFTAVGLDQFGVVMQKQPSIAWNTQTTPSGASPITASKGNSVAITLDRAGSYEFRAQVDNIVFRLPITSNATLARLELTTTDGTAVNAKSGVSTTTTNTQLEVKGYDQYGQLMSALPALTWTATRTPNGGRVTSSFSSGRATLTFTASGGYAISVRSGNAQVAFNANVIQTLTSIMPVNASGTRASASLSTSNTSLELRVRGLDQFGVALAKQPTFEWSTPTQPTGASSSFRVVQGVATVTFNRSGSYVARAAVGGVSTQFTIQVNARMVSLNVTPGTVQLSGASTQAYSVSGVDQFGQSIASVSGVVWSATGGTISSSGLYRAGNVSGTFRVTATSGAISANATVTIQALDSASSSLTDPALRSLVNTLHADNSISRAEMIQILRSAGADGSVSQAELADLRLLVTTNSGFQMPAYVRELAKDVVNSNPANLRFKGANNGNLSAGSSSVILNNLIDKWFLGADEPAINVSGATYQTASGVLFSGNPSRSDAKQGYVGDCYFIASVTSIADANAEAIRNMFLDNGDGTYTVRFFANSGADYVTVNRKLAAYSNGTMVYAGLGQSVASASAVLWVALAEKAYAQWNETGNSGRDGTNTFSGIEGGWMSNVNKQVLGYNSTNVALSTATEQQLASALGSGRAVTIGTVASVGNGLVGSHAYIVTGYNAGAGTFNLFNPWGNTHPAALTWSQLLANCDFYCVTQSSGTTPISTTSVRSGLSDTLVGNWTTVATTPVVWSDAETPVVESVETRVTDTIDFVSNAIESEIDEWTTTDDRYIAPEELAASEDKLEETVLRSIDEIAIDMAMSTESLDAILGEYA